MDYKIKKDHKDRLFCFIFGNEKWKSLTLSLYNALNNSSYKNIEDLEINTIQDVIYIKMHNDVSFLIDGNLSLYEQQSTFNPNMPLRGFLYFGKLYDKYITENKLNLYGKTLKNIPTPKYIVFYNGTEKRPKEKKLRLSDAFINEDKSGDFEWTATMINLNHQENKAFLGKCEALEAYNDLIDDIRKCVKNENYEEAVDLVIHKHIAKKNVLSDILLKHRSEVIDMVLTEFNEEVFVKSIKEEGREEGREEGIKESRKDVAIKLLKMGLSDKDIIQVTELTLEDLEKLKEEIEKQSS